MNIPLGFFAGVIHSIVAPTNKSVIWVDTSDLTIVPTPMKVWDGTGWVLLNDAFSPADYTTTVAFIAALDGSDSSSPLHAAIVTAVETYAPSAEDFVPITGTADGSPITGGLELEDGVALYGANGALTYDDATGDFQFTGGGATYPGYVSLTYTDAHLITKYYLDGRLDDYYDADETEYIITARIGEIPNVQFDNFKLTNSSIATTLDWDATTLEVSGTAVYVWNEGYQGDLDAVPAHNTFTRKFFNAMGVEVADYSGDTFEISGYVLQADFETLEDNLAENYSTTAVIILSLDPTDTAGSIEEAFTNGLIGAFDGTLSAAHTAFNTGVAGYITGVAPTAGDIIYTYAGAPTALAIGTTGQVLTVSAMGLPEWAEIDLAGYTTLTAHLDALDFISVPGTPSTTLIEGYSNFASYFETLIRGDIEDAFDGTDTESSFAIVINTRFAGYVPYTEYTTDGCILFGYSGAVDSLAAGTTAQVLTVNGMGLPEWADAETGVTLTDVADDISGGGEVATALVSAINNLDNPIGDAIYDLINTTAEGIVAARFDDKELKIDYDGGAFSKRYTDPDTEEVSYEQYLLLGTYIINQIRIGAGKFITHSDSYAEFGVRASLSDVSPTVFEFDQTATLIGVEWTKIQLNYVLFDHIGGGRREGVFTLISDINPSAGTAIFYSDEANPIAKIGDTSNLKLIATLTSGIVTVTAVSIDGITPINYSFGAKVTII